MKKNYVITHARRGKGGPYEAKEGFLGEQVTDIKSALHFTEPNKFKHLLREIRRERPYARFVPLKKNSKLIALHLPGYGWIGFPRHIVEKAKADGNTIIDSEF